MASFPHAFLVHLPLSLALLMPLFMTTAIWICEKLNRPRFFRVMTLYQLVHVVLIYAGMLSGEAARMVLGEPLLAAAAAHEERMELYFFFALATLGITFLPPVRRFLYTALAASMIQTALCIWAAHAGAMIRHG